MSVLGVTGRVNNYIRLHVLYLSSIRTTAIPLCIKNHHLHTFGGNQMHRLQTIVQPAHYTYPVFKKNVILKSPLPAIQRRGLWGWLNAIFNRVDETRIKEVGPDRACAEWLLRCGAFIKWQNREAWTTNYNSLPPGGGRLRIEEVDATDSAIMHIGFPHFSGCKYIRRIIFHKSSYLDDMGLSQLPLLHNSLTHLQISSCGNITLDGLKHIKKLENLKYLLLYDLPEINNKEEVIDELSSALPNCEISFPYAQAEDDPNFNKKEHE